MIDFSKPGEPSGPQEPGGQQPAGSPPGAEQQAQPQTEQQAQPQFGAQPQVPPAGWYADPELAGQQRYWDGAQWTEHRHGAPQPQQQIPPSPPGGYGPAYGGGAGAMSPAEERNWAIAAHLSALAAAWAALGVLGPLVVYLIKKDESPWVRAHAAAALNFHLSWLIWGISLTIVTFVLMIFIIGFLLIPVIIVGAIAWLVLVIQHTVEASNNKPPKKYPLTIDFVS